jgi:hypothetical protein
MKFFASVMSVRTVLTDDYIQSTIMQELCNLDMVGGNAQVLF